jgi:hypothetical protein
MLRDEKTPKVSHGGLAPECKGFMPLKLLRSSPLRGEGVIAAAHLNPQRGPLQLEVIPKTPLQIALVLVSDMLQRIAMDDHHRWIHTALVGVA